MRFLRKWRERPRDYGIEKVVGADMQPITEPVELDGPLDVPVDLYVQSAPLIHACPYCGMVASGRWRAARFASA